MIKKLFLLIIIVISTASQILDTIGKCLGACRQCNSKDLTVCSGTRQTMCIPGYNPNFTSASCQLNSMYKNQIKSLTSFVPNQDLSAWSDITNSICEYKTQTNQVKKISILGLYNRQFILRRNYPLIKPFTIMIFNFNLIRNSWAPFNDFILVSLRQNKKLIKSHQISTQIRTPISPDSNPIVCFNQNILNEARTIAIKLPVTNATELEVQFSSQLTSTASWGLTNIRMLYGCGQYSLLNTAGTRCQICQSNQFFPNFVNKVMDGCIKCPIQCKKCTNLTSCQQCQLGHDLKDGFCVKKQNSNTIQLKKFITGEAKKCGQNLTFIKGTNTQGVSMTPDASLSPHNRFNALFTLLYNDVQWGDNTTLQVSLRTKYQLIKVVSLKKTNLTSKAINTCSQLATYHSILTFSSEKIGIFFEPTVSYQININITNANGTEKNKVEFGISDIRIIYQQCGGVNCMRCGVDDKCTNCKGMFTLDSSCGFCPQGFGGKNCERCSSFCSSCSSENISKCGGCALGFKLSGQNCVPIESNYTQFPVEKTFGTQGQEQIQNIVCGSEISFLSPASKRLTAKILFPKHTGLVLGIKFYRVRQWTGKIQIRLDGSLIKTQQVKADGLGGYLCRGQNLAQGKDFSYIYIHQNISHKNIQSQFQILGDGKLAVSELIIFLKDCKQCQKKNETKNPGDQKPQPQTTSLPTFPQPVTSDYSNIDILPQTSQEKQQAGVQIKMDLSYSHKIDQLNVTIDRLAPKYQKILSYQVVGNIHYLFVRINQSFTNGLMEIYGKVPVQQILPDQPSNSLQPTPSLGQIRNLQNQTRVLKTIILRRKNIERFDVLTIQETDPMQGLSKFFMIISWIAITGYIISIPLSYGVIFEQLIINLQNIFLLVYINPQFLPFSLSKSIAGLERIQNLDFFTNQNYNAISSSWLGNVIQDTPLYLTQFKIDLNFLRAFIPIIIINIFFLIWFIAVAILNYKFQKDLENNNRDNTKFMVLVHSVGGRPINYFDQIFRIQFMTTVWLCFIQFKNFTYPQNADRSEAFNILICIFSLGLSLAWFIFTILYTKYQQRKLALTLYTENYEDIFYRRSSLMNYPTIHVYISNVFKFIPLFLFILAAAYMNTEPVLWFSVCIMLNIIYIIYSWKVGIYTDKFAFTLKIVDLTFLIIICLLMIIIFGVGDQMHKQGYFVLGYFVVAMCIGLILNSFVRVFYYGYKKISELMFGMKDESQFVKPVDTQRIV